MADYGQRPDGTAKGSGWLGELKMLDGSDAVMTEKSVGVNLDGKEMLIPSIVPTLTPDEIDWIAKGGDVLQNKEIIDKAAAHAIGRLKEGKSPFKEEDTEYRKKIGIR